MTTIQLAALALSAAACLSGCATPEASEVAVARAVRVVDARAPEPPRGLRYAVTIQPSEHLALAVKAGGYVAAIREVGTGDGRHRALQPGDVVRAGTVLLRLRDAEYRERLHQAEGALQEAEAGRVKARSDLNRSLTLFTAESLTKPDLDAAQAAFSAADARTTSARAQVEGATLALADCTLASPIDGVVLERRVEMGVLASAGTVTFVLGRLAEVEAVLGVPDGVVSRLALGQPLTMTTEAFPGRQFNGRVTSVAPTADAQSRIFAVEVTLPNGDGQLRPGMVGVVEVAAATSSDATTGVAVPLVAVVRSPQHPKGYSVFVVDSAAGHDVARARAVTLGATLGNAVAIADGLHTGERVIVMGATLVHDGETVRVIP